MKLKPPKFRNYLMIVTTNLFVFTAGYLMHTSNGEYGSEPLAAFLMAIPVMDMSIYSYRVRGEDKSYAGFEIINSLIWSAGMLSLIFSGAPILFIIGAILLSLASFIQFIGALVLTTVLNEDNQTDSIVKIRNSMFENGSLIRT